MVSLSARRAMTFCCTRACSCTAKFGQQLAGLGALDNAGSGDVAVASDPAPVTFTSRPVVGF